MVIKNWTDDFMSQFIDEDFLERYKVNISASDLQHSCLWCNIVEKYKMQFTNQIAVAV